MVRDALSNLIIWAQGNGLKVSSDISFQHIGPGNNGAFLDSSGSDTPTISLPIDLALTPLTALKFFNDSLGFKADIFDLPTNSLLKLYLARERAPPNIENSFYSAYLKSLPDSREINSPYFWDKKTKEYLNGTNLKGSLRDNIQKILEEWWEVINILPQETDKPQEHFINMKFYYEFKFYTEDELYDYLVTNSDKKNWTSFSNFLWASVILSSRSFPYRLLNGHSEKSIYDEKEDSAMLLPVIDVLNHSNSVKVDWNIDNIGDSSFFTFVSHEKCEKGQLFNNYGQKGNEELLLSYGFCLENNSFDYSALKIKVPLEMLPQIEQKGVKLPHISDYTTSSLYSSTRASQKEGKKISDYSQYADGLLFLISKTQIPNNLITLFQFLVKNSWEKSLTLRMQLEGINRLRDAIVAKKDLLKNAPSPIGNNNISKNINIYVSGQEAIFSSAISTLKHLERGLLTNKSNRPLLISLKKILKEDQKFQYSLLLSLGITSYESVINSQLQDQVWLLYLIRCYNRDEYIRNAADEEENFIPKWIQDAFIRMKKETTITAEETLKFKDLYESLIIPLVNSVAEVYDRGSWTVDDLIVSAALLDTISFVRGKERECILVESDDYNL